MWIITQIMAAILLLTGTEGACTGQDPLSWCPVVAGKSVADLSSVQAINTEGKNLAECQTFCEENDGCLSISHTDRGAESICSTFTLGYNDIPLRDQEGINFYYYVCGSTSQCPGPTAAPAPATTTTATTTTTPAPTPAPTTTPTTIPTPTPTTTPTPTPTTTPTPTPTPVVTPAPSSTMAPTSTPSSSAEPEPEAQAEVTPEEFWEWLRDHPVYMAMAGMGLMILLLFIIIIVLLCRLSRNKSI